MTRNRTPIRKGLWNRTTQALGKLLAGMVSLPDNPRHAANEARWTDYPRFPPY